MLSLLLGTLLNMRGSEPAGVFVDANVLYSKTLLDWLGLLYVNREFEPPFVVYWSDDVMVEAMRQLRRHDPRLPGGTIARFRERLEGTFEVGHVRDYDVDGTYGGPDEHDAHVHAAAVACGASYLLTCNVRDFRTATPDTLPYEVITPDEFFLLIDDCAPDLVQAVIGEQIHHLTQRGRRVELPEGLQRAGCPHFAERVLRHLRRRALLGG